MADNIFEELVIYVLTYPGVGAAHRHGLISKLEEHGAEIRTRFGKDVTHVVVQQAHSASEDGRAAGDAQLRAVFDKIEKASSKHLLYTCCCLLSSRMLTTHVAYPGARHRPNG